MCVRACVHVQVCVHVCLSAYIDYMYLSLCVYALLHKCRHIDREIDSERGKQARDYVI